MKLLSLCIIVKNEERNLPECLRGIKDVVDEIIVVDTGSSDGTVEIAKSFTDKVYSFEWIDDFSAARNFSVEKAESSYVIWLDADDRLDERSCNSLRRIKEALDPGKPVSYSFKITNVTSGGRRESCFQLRLFPKLSGIRFEGRVHEDISFSITRLGIPIIYDGSVEITHVGYSDPGENLEKARRNLRLLIEDYRETGSWKTSYYLGHTYLYLGDRKRALEFFLKSLTEEARKISPPIYLYSAMKGSEIMFEDGRHEEAISLLENACSKIEISDAGRILLGKFYLLTQQFDKALSTLLSIDIGRLSLVLVPMDIGHVKGVYYQCLGDAYRVKGLRERSLESYRKAVCHLKDHRALLSVGKILMEESDYPSSQRAFERAFFLAEHKKERSLILTLLSISMLAQGKELEAERALKEALSLEPRNLRAARYLSDILIGKGDLAGAIGVLGVCVESCNGQKIPVLSRLSYVYAKLLMFDELLKVTEEMVKEIFPGTLFELGSLLDLSRLYRDMAEKVGGLEDGDVKKYLMATSLEVYRMFGQKGFSTDK